MAEQGIYTGISPGGKYQRRWRDGKNCRYTAKPHEISLVDVPCIPSASFTLIKADGAEIEVPFQADIRSKRRCATKSPASAPAGAPKPTGRRSPGSTSTRFRSASRMATGAASSPRRFRSTWRPIAASALKITCRSKPTMRPKASTTSRRHPARACCAPS